MNGLVAVDDLISTLNSMGGIESMGGFNPNLVNEFKKALTATSGYTGYNLEREVKMRLPAYTILRNRVAVDAAPMGAMAGPQAHYKMQLGYNGFNFATAMGTAFGANGSDGNPSATDIGADYKSQSIHGAVQLEAIDLARQFTDPIKDQSMFNLQTLMRLEELIVLGGNEASLGSPNAVTATASTTTAGAVFATGNWTFAVTALTLQGCLANASSNSNSGETVMATVTQAAGASGTLFFQLSWAPLVGAMGYKVYANRAAAGGVTLANLFLCDPATNLAYTNTAAAAGPAYVVQQAGQTYITVTAIDVIAIPGALQPNPVNTEGSANTNLFEGYWAWSTKTTMYGVDVSGGTGGRVFVNQGGAALTAENSGIKEINNALQSLWFMYHTAPTLLVAGPATIRSITNKVTGNNNTSMMLIGNQGGNLQSQNKFIGGIMVGGYTNMYAQHAGMSTLIDLIAHPYMPEGNIMLLSEALPPDTYRFAQDSRCFALDVLRPYNYFPLASTDRNINFDIWFLETLKCYYPTAQAAIAGIRVDA